MGSHISNDAAASFKVAEILFPLNGGSSFLPDDGVYIYLTTRRHIP
jgi:hypothetical protein